MNLSAEDLRLLIKAVDYWLNTASLNPDEHDDMILLRIEVLHHLKQVERRQADAKTPDQDAPGVRG